MKRLPAGHRNAAARKFASGCTFTTRSSGLQAVTALRIGISGESPCLTARQARLTVTEMKQESLQEQRRSVASWVGAVGCATGGAMASLLLPRLAEEFEGGVISVPARIVFFVGPLGWLLLSLLTASLIIRFRGSKLSEILALCCLATLVAAMCAVTFTTVSCPGFRGSSF